MQPFWFDFCFGFGFGFKFFDKVISRKTSKCFKTFTFLLTLLSLINGQTSVSCRSTERKTQNDSRNVIMRNLCLGHKINVALFLAFTNLFVVCF